jgi:hypothetical protein
VVVEVPEIVLAALAVLETLHQQHQVKETMVLPVVLVVEAGAVVVQAGLVPTLVLLRLEVAVLPHRFPAAA